MLERSLGPGSDVELFVRARTGQVAGHDVTYGVAACLAAGQAHLGQLAHQVGHAGQLDVVHLHVLSCGDVAPTSRVLVADPTQQVELLGRDGAGGQLDAHHLVGATLALAVHAVVQAHDAKDVFRDLAGHVLRDRALEPLDVTVLLFGEITRYRNDGCDAH